MQIITKSHDRTYLYTTLTVWKLSTKSDSFADSALRLRQIYAMSKDGLVEQQAALVQRLALRILLSWRMLAGWGTADDAV